MSERTIRNQVSSTTPSESAPSSKPPSERPIRGLYADTKHTIETLTPEGKAALDELRKLDEEDAKKK
jgi:hypothetical protein